MFRNLNSWAYGQSFDIFKNQLEASQVLLSTNRTFDTSLKSTKNVGKLNQVHLGMWLEPTSYAWNLAKHDIYNHLITCQLTREKENREGEWDNLKQTCRLGSKRIVNVCIRNGSWGGSSGFTGLKDENGTLTWAK